MSVMVLPGSGYSIESFREDDGYCRQYAHIQIGGKTAEVRHLAAGQLRDRKSVV